MNNLLRFTPLANVTPRKRRARYEFIKQQKLFAFRLSGWFVMGQVPVQPLGHQGVSTSSNQP